MHYRSLLILVACASAAPTVDKRVTLAPTVVIKNGTVVGSSDGTVDSFNGIPYAQPPIASLRLKPPMTVTKTFGTITATGTPTACPQMGIEPDLSALPVDVAALVLDSSFVQNATVTGEDCLTLNVQRPSTATSASKLPVVFWIYGGGFEAGSTQTYDGTTFIEKSISLGHDVIYVAVNYRVSGFGFLAGKQLQADGSTNLGLRDQRLGLEWVQENIAAFGGDPTKVTIWGESAGSISVFDHTIINGGNNAYNGGKLFRGAIMDSGSIVPTVPVNSSKAQAVYDTVVAAAGCSSAQNSLTCLRSVSYQTFLAAVNSVPGIFSYRSVDLAYLPRPDPSNAFFPRSPELSVKAGAYTKVPIIIGDQEDEGTLFSLSQSNITDTDELVTYFASFFPDTPQSLVAQFVATYPDDAADGSPFNTSSANEIYPEFKRLAAIIGDTTFTLTRRTYLAAVASSLSAWSYLGTYYYGTPVLGTFHSTDILEAFDGAPLVAPANAIQTYYISFINYLNPNTISIAAPLISWPQWNNNTVQMMNFSAAENILISDNFRQASYQFLASHTSSFRV